MKRNNSKKKNLGMSNNNNGMGGVVMGPPPFKVNLRQQRFIMRYDVAAGGFTVTYNALLRALGATSVVGGSTILLLFEAVRLREVRLYGSAQNTGSIGSNVVSLEWAPITVSTTVVQPGVDTTRSNTSTTSTAGSTYLIKKPAKDSIAGSWLNNQGIAVAGIPLFTGAAPAGSILDIVMDVVVNDGSNPFLYALVTGGATSGIFGYVPHANLTPQDYPPYS